MFFMQHNLTHENKQSGFSAIELLLVVVIAAAIATISISYSNSLVKQTSGEVVTNQAYNYAQAVIRYITTHQNLLRQLLSQNDVGNGKIATVTANVLVRERFIRNNLYNQNKLNQLPCTIIWYNNHQLQAIIYFRDTNNSKHMDYNQLVYGLSHMGSMMGLYENGSVVGAAKNWSIDQNFVRQMFITQGTADISGTSDPSYYCAGSQIANPSYVVNVTSMLNLYNTLPKDDTIHQYTDVLHDSDDLQSNNRMNVDLNMDYTRPDGRVRTQSNIVFQLNQNCRMDPKNIASMQDYDPNVDGRDPRNYNIPNSLGCKNLQLSIEASKDPINPSSNQDVMAITGFQKGGNPNLWRGPSGSDTRPNVGELVAASLQPISEVTIGTSCSEKEIGTMVRQQKSDNPDDINNIYVSQLVCMKSPLCEAETNGFCYMPVQNTTIQIQPNTPKYICYAGTFIDNSSLTINHIDLTGKGTCHAHDCFWQPFDCVARNPRQGPLEYSYPLNTAFQSQAPLYTVLTIPTTSWEQWCGDPCHFGCGEGPGQIGDTQDTISSIQCTNDPSKAAIIVQVN